jgi:2,4-dienoyl-CoA reductase-like NADH-dependent reductase (Old Yellow Enzyme family)
MVIHSAIESTTQIRAYARQERRTCMPTLFDPIQIGDLTLPNRILMAPLTRQRAGDIRVPNTLMAKYYAERASAGMIISEATSVTPQGVGYAATPGIWSEEQVEGWKLVSDASMQQAAGFSCNSGTLAVFPTQCF